MVDRRELILTASLALLGFPGCGQMLLGEKKAARGLQRAICVLGDSLALGLGADRPEEGFVFKAVTNLMASYALTLTNFAIIGATAADVLRLQVPRIRPASFDVGIVCVGANDAKSFSASGDFASAYDGILSAIRRNGKCRLICCGIPDVSLSPRLSKEEAMTAQVLIREYNASIRSLASTNHGSFVDYSFLNGTRGLFSGDGYHPSSAGYEKMVAALQYALNNAVRLRH
jgi:lysophospholipase L1-like esterase